MELSLIQKIFIFAPPFIFAVAVHEVAHGLAARALGDRTAEMMGRLTLNPIRHIDPMGSVLVPGMLLLSGAPFLFGWAKPVPVDIRNLHSPQRDMALVAAAGPISNLAMAVFWALLIHVAVMLQGASPLIGGALFEMARFGVLINVVLAVFNAIPIPPLDGSRVVVAAMSPRMAQRFLRFETYGFIVIALLLLSGLLWPVISPMMGGVARAVLVLTGHG